MAKRSLDIIINGRDRTGKAFKSAEGGMAKLTKAAKVAGAAIASALAVREIARFGKDILALASDAEEAGSKSVAIFGEQVESINIRLDDFSEKAGRSRFALREMAGDFGALIAPMGFTERAAADMSVQLTRLSTDLASFFNTSDQQALTALRAGLVGESEPLRKYGVQLSAVRIEQELFSKGIVQTKDQITPAMKAQAAFNIIMQDTAQAQGDAIRTSDSLANLTKDLKGDWADFKTELGQEFLPVAKDVLQWFKDVRGEASGLADDIARVIGGRGMTARDILESGSRLGGLRERLKQQSTADELAAEASRSSPSSFPFVGPLPREFYEPSDNKLKLPEVETVELPNASLPGIGGNDAPGSPVIGQFLTGLAQIGRSQNLQGQMYEVAKEARNLQRDSRDLLDRLLQRVDNGEPVVLGLFS